MIIFTSICSNYLHKARTLAESVKKNIPDAIFIVSLLEKEIPNYACCKYFDAVILAKDAWGEGFERFIFKHTIVEASTSVKGRFFQYLYEKYPKENKFVYLDPDVYVYSDFVELRSLLDTRPIVLCPHLLQPGNIDMELSSTAHGVYNLGFLAVNRSEEAICFINWWAERLRMFCYDDMARGIFTDQKWVDLAPSFFDVEILKHKGYDFATWSLLDCGMYEGNGRFYVQGDELRFIHFSGYRNTIEWCVKRWLPEGNHAFKKLFKQYSKLHDANDSDGVSKTKWSYATYDSGEKIKDKVRYSYRNSPDLMYCCDNPFVQSNSFYEIQIINKKEIKKARKYWEKSKSIYNNDGFMALLHKAGKKIF